ncbi:hypothetical protein Trydic_g11240 [Trypoxylus dichotomus]
MDAERPILMPCGLTGRLSFFPPYYIDHDHNLRLKHNNGAQEPEGTYRRLSKAPNGTVVTRLYSETDKFLLTKVRSNLTKYIPKESDRAVKRMSLVA